MSCSAEVLSWLAEQIAEVVDGRGPLGRVDEDAFGVFLPAMALADACRVGETLRMKIASVRHPASAGPFRLTVSVGSCGAEAK